MNPAEEMTAKPGAAGSEKSDQQLHTILENLGRVAPQDDLHSGLTPRLDLEALERKALDDRLGAIENQTKKRSSRGFTRYLLAICIGAAAIPGLAILRRSSQTNVRGKGSGTWMVAGDQADDRELGRAAWLDEAADHLSCSAVRVGDAASGTRCADCARERHS